MNAVVGALRVTLGLDSAELVSGFKKSSAAAKGFDGDIKKISVGFEGTMLRMGAAIGTFGKTLVGGLVAGGIAGIVSQVQTVARSVAEVGDQARIAGVNVKAFQELKFVAEQNRIGVDALTDGIKELNLRADEFILSDGKSGAAAEAFKRLGFDAQTLKEKLKDPSALFTEIIGKLGQLDKAAQIRIADEIFGGSGGEQFVQLIEQGERGIRETIKAANDLGIVMDEQLIARAAEVDRQFNIVANTIGTTLKSAIVSAVSSLAEFIDGFRAFEDQQSRTLESRQAEIGLKKLDIETKILEKQQEQRDELSKLSSVAQNLGFEDSKNSLVAGNTGQINALRDEMKALADEEARIVNVLSTRTSPLARSGNDTWTPPVISTTDKKSGSSRADREREAITQLIAEMEEELRVMGLSDAEKRKSEILRRAGSAATAEERARLVELNEAQFQTWEAISRNAEQMDFYRGVTRSAIDDIISGVEQGKSAWEIFADVATNALRRIGDALIDDVLNNMFKINQAGTSGSSGGLLGTLLGGVFGGGSQISAVRAGAVGLFADGGQVRGPGTGRSDSILARLSNGEFVINAAATGRHLPLLRAINDGTYDAFATGGLVGPRLGERLSRGGGVGGAGSSGGVTVNVINNSASVQISQSQRKTSGGTAIDVQIDELNARKINEPGSATNRAMVARGVREPLSRR